MADNRKALIRYLAYDRCLSNTGRRYGWKDLLEEANQALVEEGLEGVGKSQFYNDITFLQTSEWNAPIETYRDGGHKVYYRYSDPNFSIKNQPLNKTELEQIKSAITVLSRFRGLPQFDWLYEMIPALEEKLGVVSTEREIIAFDSNIEYEGNEWLSILFKAAVNKRVLRVKYKKFNQDEAFEFLFHVHYLKQYNGRWFAFGLNQDLNIDTWNSPLDRIVDITELDNEYIETKINWFDYFEDMVGVTKLPGQKSDKLKLLVSEKTWPYVKTKPLHGSQKLLGKKGEDYLIEIDVIQNYEFTSLINSYGGEIKIVKE